MKYIIHVFKNYCTFKGRAGRKEFWLFILFNAIVLSIFVFADSKIFPEIKAGMFGVLVESFGSGFGLPYLLHWYEMHPEVTPGYGPLAIIYVLGTLLPNISLTVRRLHDIELNGWLFLPTILPVIGWMWWFVIGLFKGNTTENNYGDIPTL